MNYEERYKKALERARIGLHDCNLLDCDDMTRRAEITTIYHLFPELNESEDERIRKVLLNDFKNNCSEYYCEGVTRDMVIAWLEKQGEQKTAVYDHKFHVGDIVKSKSQPMLDARKIISIDKDCYWCEDKGCLGFAWEDDYVLVEQKPTDKAEPKFKVGDWVILNGTVAQILDKQKYGFVGLDIDGKDFFCNYGHTDSMRLWSINDAKDGDVLAYVTDEEDLWIMIYRSLYEPYEGHVHYHALLVNDNFSDKGTCCICIDNLKPATKEQRELLFAKMKEAGYEWNADKKELKKVESKKLDPDKVIGWLVANICDYDYYVKLFKKDFGI